MGICCHSRWGFSYRHCLADNIYCGVVVMNAVIEIQLYGQDGVLRPLRIQDTPDLRRFAEWVKRHDRYTEHDRIGERERSQDTVRDALP